MTLFPPKSRAKFLGAPPILACLLRSVGHCRKPSRQGCLRSQELCLDSFDAAVREDRANCQFALHFLRRPDYETTDFVDYWRLDCGNGHRFSGEWSAVADEEMAEGQRLGMGLGQGR